MSDELNIKVIEAFIKMLSDETAMHLFLTRFSKEQILKALVEKLQSNEEKKSDTSKKIPKKAAPTKAERKKPYAKLVGSWADLCEEQSPEKQLVPKRLVKKSTPKSTSDKSITEEAEIKFVIIKSQTESKAIFKSENGNTTCMYDLESCRRDCPRDHFVEKCECDHFCDNCIEIREGKLIVKKWSVSYLESCTKNVEKIIKRIGTNFRTVPFRPSNKKHTQ
jgi:hypothetical protein